MNYVEVVIHMKEIPFFGERWRPNSVKEQRVKVRSVSSVRFRSWLSELITKTFILFWGRLGVLHRAKGQVAQNPFPWFLQIVPLDWFCSHLFPKNRHIFCHVLLLLNLTPRHHCLPDEKSLWNPKLSGDIKGLHILHFYNIFRIKFAVAKHTLHSWQIINQLHKNQPKS